jgi:hypothetical protein
VVAALPQSIANAFEEEKNLVKICSVSDLTMCVKIQELASDATRQERSLQFGEESEEPGIVHRHWPHLSQVET